MTANDMYKDIILEYYRNPRNYGTLEKMNAEADDVNPLCGDEIKIQMKIENDRIKDIKFSGHGCAISQASASMLTEMLVGKDVNYVKKLGKEDILKMLGIELSHVRIKCAMLGLKVVKLAAYKYLGEKMEEDE